MLEKERERRQFTSAAYSYPTAAASQARKFEGSPSLSDLIQV